MKFITDDFKSLYACCYGDYCDSTEGHDIQIQENAAKLANVKLKAWLDRVFQPGVPIYIIEDIIKALKEDLKEIV